jgi:hypothetical protein
MNRILTPHHPGTSVVMATSQSHEFYTQLARNLLSDIPKNKAGVYLKISQAQTSMLVVSFQGCHYPGLLPDRVYLLDRVAEDQWTGVILPFIVTHGNFCVDITPDGKHVAVGFLDSGVILLRKQAPGQWHEEQQIPKGTYGLPLTDSANLKFAGRLHFSPNSRVLMLGGLCQGPGNAWLCPAAFLFVYCQGKWHYAHGQYSQGVLERGWFEQIMGPWLKHTEDALCRAIEAQLPAPELINEVPDQTAEVSENYPSGFDGRLDPKRTPEEIARVVLDVITELENLQNPCLCVPFIVEGHLIVVSGDKRVIALVYNLEAVKRGLQEGHVEILSHQPNGSWRRQVRLVPEGFKTSGLGISAAADVITVLGGSPTEMFNLYHHPRVDEWQLSPLPSEPSNEKEEVETEADLVSALKLSNRKTEFTGSLETSTGIKYEALVGLFTKSLTPKVRKSFEHSRLFFSQSGQVIVLAAVAVDLEERPLRNGLYVLWRDSQNQWVGCLTPYDPSETHIILTAYDETIILLYPGHTP